MRQKLLSEGAKELEYEIRDIVKKAEKVQAIGQEIYFENIGDPIQKNAEIPAWIKDIVSGLVQDDKSYGYCHSKGVLETREFIAARTNARGNTQVTADDVLFFNGLGDAIAKVYQYLDPTSRVIGPSPAYSTHSSAEAAHAGKLPMMYQLDPRNNWLPDLVELENMVKYNPGIVGILVINPDNPTGMVYPLETLQAIVNIAKKYDLFIISDEIYTSITYNGKEAIPLCDVIGDVPGIAMKGISKELPWPGSRCGWMEFYNRNSDFDFDQLCSAIEDAKMIEVCSTTLPQKAIPQILGSDKFNLYREKENRKIGERSKSIADILGDVPFIYFNETFGAFYNTIVFKEGVLKKGARIPISDPKKSELFESWVTEDMDLDKVFVYNLLVATGVCVVPLSSFHSDLKGFRITLLENDKELLTSIFHKIKKSLFDFCS